MALRTNDYHPDHRYVGVLVQDAAYMVTVPFFCPDTPALKTNPVFLYFSDRFTKPTPFTADVAVAIDEVFEKKIHAIANLESQIFEGGAGGSEEFLRQVPQDPDDRIQWLIERRRIEGRLADQYRDALIRWYGPERGRRVKFAEVFEICEYGRHPTREELAKLFPFSPK